MSNFTVQTIRAAALLLFAAVCTAVQADGPKRIVSVQKAKKHVVLNSAESAVTPTPLKARPGKSSTAQRDILVDEDFSGITWGSEEQPDTTSYLASSYYEPGIYIDPSMTKDGTLAGLRRRPRHGRRDLVQVYRLEHRRGGVQGRIP